jgi:hypothetical protein
MLSTQRVGARGWKPTVEEELLLGVALSPRSEVGEAWTRLTRAVEIQALDHPSHDLLPMVYRRLADAGVKDPWLGRLKGFYRRTWYRNQLLMRLLAEPLGVIGAEGVSPILLGGASVGLLHYRQIGARDMSDTSIALRPGEIERALAALGRANQRVPPMASLEDDGLCAATVPLEVAGAGAHAPSPEDQLLRTCAGAITSTSRPNRCRWVADAFAILDSSREELDWPRLIAQAVDNRVLPQLRPLLSYLRETFSAPVPFSAVARGGDAGGP